MSQRTADALARLDELVGALAALPQGVSPQLVEETEALRRAVSAFHMEAIRFRMYAVDRALRAAGDPGETRRVFEALRQALETAGFHTRSHTAP